jgi:hypothetical protein
MHIHAYEAKKGRVTGSIGLNTYGRVKSNEHRDYFPNSRYGFSLQGEACMHNQGALEIGIFYFKKSYLRENAGLVLIEDRERVYITTGYRLWWHKNFSSAAALFSSFSIGGPEQISPDEASGLELKSSQRITNYGLDLSARVEFDLNTKESLFLDFRYSFNISAAVDKEEADHYLIGLSYARQIDIK